jgi:hypothetical protein
MPGATNGSVSVSFASKYGVFPSAWKGVDAAMARLFAARSIVLSSAVISPPTKEDCLFVHNRWQVEGQRNILVHGNSQPSVRCVVSVRRIMSHILVSDEVRSLAGAGA